MRSSRLYNRFGSRRGLKREDISSFGEKKSGLDQNALEQKSLESCFDADAAEGWEQLGYDVGVLSNLDKQFAPSGTSPAWYIGGGIGAIGVAVATYLIVTSAPELTPAQEPTPTESGLITTLLEDQQITLDESDVVLPAPIEQLRESPKKLQVEIDDIKVDFAEIKESHINELPPPIVQLPILDINIEDEKDLEIIKAHESAKEIYLHGLKLLDYRNYRSEPHVKTRHMILTGTPAYQEHDSSEVMDPVWKEVEIPYIEYIDKSMKTFERGNYKKALYRFETILGTYETDINAHFYSGICLFNHGEYKRAIHHFDACLNGPYSNFDEEALWMKALCLEKSGKQSEALAIYQKIKKSGGFYADQAEEKLN